MTHLYDASLALACLAIEMYVLSLMAHRPPVQPGRRVCRCTCMPLLNQRIVLSLYIYTHIYIIYTHIYYTIHTYISLKKKCLTGLLYTPPPNRDVHHRRGVAKGRDQHAKLQVCFSCSSVNAICRRAENGPHQANTHSQNIRQPRSCTRHSDES